MVAVQLNHSTYNSWILICNNKIFLGFKMGTIKPVPDNCTSVMQKLACIAKTTYSKDSKQSLVEQRR